jgi:hypothetical protein
MTNPSLSGRGSALHGQVTVPPLITQHRRAGRMTED